GVLPLVAAYGREVADGRRLGLVPVLQDVLGGAVRQRAVARPLVREATRPANAGDDVTGLDGLLEVLAVGVQVDERAYRLRRQHEPVGEPPPRPRGQPAVQERQQQRARELVVGQRRVARVGGQQHLV